MTIRDLQDALTHVARECDWEQFHTPKNLVVAPAGEAGELTEIFAWLTPELSWAIVATSDQVQAVGQVMADTAGADLDEAVVEKIELNRMRRTVDLAYGRLDKCTSFGE